METASATVNAAVFTSGKWTCSLEAEWQAEPPATDIVERVISVKETDRNHPDFGEIGQTLYSWLFPAGPVRARWDALLAQGTPSVALEIGHEGLASLPWEMAQSPAPDYFAAAVISGMSRRHRVAPAPSVCSPWPFRIFFVVGCSEAEEAELGIDRELEAVERTFVPFGRSVDVFCLRRPSREELKTWVGKYHPHVLHFAGHGAIDPERNQPGLMFKAGKTEAESWILTGREIPSELRASKWRPAFVFLNACRSGVGHSASQSVQRGFLAAGTKVVLGMQADIRGDLAGPFAAEVYRQCAEGRSIQRAVLEGRPSLSPQGLGYIDWSLPVLYASEPELKLYRPVGTPNSLAYERCREFEEARFFANCHEGRRALTYWFRPATPPAEENPLQNVAMLVGQPRSGKSHLLKWCMESWALSGAQVRYIEIDGRGAKDFLSILRQIKDGDSNGDEDTLLLHGGLDKAAFRRFEWELKNFIETGQAGEWNEAQHGGLNIVDDGRSLQARGERRIESSVCERFLDALKLAATEAPIILVFDRFTGSASEKLLLGSEFEHLVQYLFRPIALDPASRIKLVFAVNQGQQSEFGLDKLPVDGMLTWKLPIDYAGDLLPKLAAEMLRFQEEAKVVNITKSVLAFPPDPGTFVGLALLRLVFEFIEARSGSLLENVRRMR